MSPGDVLLRWDISALIRSSGKLQCWQWSLSLDLCAVSHSHSTGNSPISSPKKFSGCDVNCQMLELDRGGFSVNTPDTEARNKCPQAKLSGELASLQTKKSSSFRHFARDKKHDKIQRIQGRSYVKWLSWSWTRSASQGNTHLFGDTVIQRRDVEGLRFHGRCNSMIRWAGRDTGSSLHHAFYSPHIKADSISWEWDDMLSRR